MAELDHRVKNTLANIQALVVQSSRSAESLTIFVEGLDKRIRSMAKAHSLLTQSRWEGVSVDGLLREELEPYRQTLGGIDLTGFEAVLTPKSALALSLALHELATNAAKFGAFSTPTGSISVSWHLREDGGLGLIWIETGGPVVEPPTRRGFGSNLIERALALETDGHAVIRYERTGVVCEIILPASSLVLLNPKTIDPTPLAPKNESELAAIPARPRILVVEDSYLLILMMESMCTGLGWEIVGPATRLKSAMLLAATEPLDAALLDVNLAGEMSWEVATILKKRNIPFAFSTGYGEADLLPESLAGSLVVSKPYEVYDVEQCLRQLMGGRAESPQPA